MRKNEVVSYTSPTRRTRRLQTSCAYHFMGEATVDGPWVLSALMRAALA